MQRLKHLFLTILFINFISLNCVQAQIILVGNKWQTGQKLNVLFMNGSGEEKLLFKRAVGIWAKYVNLEFEFQSNNSKRIDSKFMLNTIRVKFNKDEGNFSPLGNRFNTKSLNNIPYLNIGESSKQKIKFISKSAHEIGHALGLIHEHQHPDVTIYKDEEELLGICRYLFMLDIEKTEELKKCKVNLTGITHDQIDEYGMRLSSFDEQSIMLYTDISKTNKGFYDTRVSLGDKSFIASEYPHKEPLSLNLIESMNQEDIEEERIWLLREYRQGECILIQEDDNLFLTKQTETRFIKFKMPAMSTIDSYFSACIRS